MPGTEFQGLLEAAPDGQNMFLKLCFHSHGQQGPYCIEQAGSKHGTFENGKPVKRRALRSGDETAIGESVLRFEEIQFR